MPESDRRTRLLQAALHLVADAGLGAVTHRSVERAAEAPHGSVTYWFGSREGLISALIDWICEESERQAGAIADWVQGQLESGRAVDVEAVVDALVAWIDGNLTHHLARLELQLQGAREPRHAERMTEAATVFWNMCVPITAVMGSADPERDGHAMAAMIDGMLLDRISHAPQDRGVMAAAVRWLLAGPPPA